MAIPRLFVFDLEQTCDDVEPVNSDIIQVGFCNVNVREQKVLESSYYYVKTTEPITEYCTNLTGITQSRLNRSGLEFTHVCSLLQKKFGTRNSIAAGWGDDLNSFKSQLLRQGLSLEEFFPFGSSYIDLSKLFTIKTGIRRASLLKALKYYGYEFEGTQHNAYFDALNTAKVALKLL